MFKNLFSKLFTHWKSITAIIVILTLSIFSYFIFLKPKDTAIKYVTSPVTLGSISVNVSASGSVAISKQQNAGFRTAGKLNEIYVNVGDTVKAGQKLAKLDTTQLDAQVSLSQSSLNQANNNLKKTGVSTYTQYDVANLQESINSAQSRVNLDQINLGNTTLTSPIDGIITKISNSVGDTVSGSGVSTVNTSVSNTSIPNTSTPAQGSNNGSSAFISMTDNNSQNPRNVNFSVSGKLSEIDVNVGDHVSANQVLAKLDPTTYKNTLAQSQSSLNQAYNNLKKTTTTSSITQYDISNLQENINSAQAKLNVDKDNLNNATLTSNIDGVVVDINNVVGDNVSGIGSNSQNTTTAQASAIMTIVDPNSLQVNLSIGESDIAKISLNQIAQLSFDALGDKKYVGHVSSIDSTATITSNVVSYNVKVSINKIDSNIKQGMTANASIITQTKDNILTVPNASVKTVSGQKTVQLYDTNTSTLSSVTVKTGISNDTDTEITDGLKEGDPVVTAIINPNATKTSTTTTNPLQIGGGTVRGAGGAGGFRGN